MTVCNLQVRCGECKIITVQLHNHKEVRCDWSASYLPKRDDKFVPMHLKQQRKRRQRQLEASGGESGRPRTFEIMPPSGTLLAGQRVNIQLKFVPAEERAHEERVTVC